VITGVTVVLSLTGPGYPVAAPLLSRAVPDFADDPSSELERKAKALKFVALFETVTYLLLAYFWLVARNDAMKAVVGFLHGLVWMTFVAMTVIIRPDLGWTWGYTALVVITGPIGGVLVWWRLRTTPRAVFVPQRSPSADH
jgi:Domain of unknown function (DUF3817)